MNPSRRVILAGVAGLAAGSAGKAAASGRTDTSAPTADLFTAHSSDGTQLSGHAQGDRQWPEILLIHGLRQSRLSWEKQLADPALARFRLVSFDLRGHGDSDKPAALEAYSEADRWADDVAAVIAAAGLRRPILVGWSLGGFVAGAYLRKYGGSGIAGINLVDAVTRLSPDLLGADSARFGRTTVSHDLAERTAATSDFLAACFHQPPNAEDMQRMLVVNGMAARAVGEGFVRTETADLEPVFKAYAGPILLTHGRHDRLVRLAMSERIKAIHARSRLSIFDASGHSPFYEEPERYGRELAEFARAAARG